MTDTISDPTPAEAETPKKEEKDLEAILPQPGEPFEIGAASGSPVLVRVNRLKTREFLALMRAITRGVGPGLSHLTLAGSEDEQVAEMLGIVVMAIPEAGDDFVEFVQTVTVAVGKDDAQRVQQELRNPEIDDTLRIIEQVVTQEIDDLQALLGKVQSMWTRMVTMYQKRSSGG